MSSVLYDVVGNLTSTTDPLGVVTGFEHDNLGRRTRSIQDVGGLNIATDFTYDLVGNLLTLTDASDNTTSYQYDELDRVHYEVNQLSNSRSYSYDLNGNLLQITDRNDDVRSFTYDNLDRRLNEMWSTTTDTTVSQSINYSYNVSDNLVNVTEYTDSSSSLLAFRYDQLDRVVGTYTSSGAPDGIFGTAPTVDMFYSYDFEGDLIQSSATIDGTFDFVNNFDHDDAGRLTPRDAFDQLLIELDRRHRARNSF